MSLIFASPWFALLLVIPILYLWRYFKKKNLDPAVKFSMFSYAKKLDNGGTGNFLKYLSIFLRFFSIVLIVLGLMRLQDRTAVPVDMSNSSEGTDIVICLDTSPSMLALDFGKEDRLTIAKNVISTFIKGRPNDRLGLVVFSGASLTLCPLTIDHQALLSMISKITYEITHSDGTAIGDAIATSLNRLKKSPAKSKVIILVTDGSNNMGHISPETASDLAVELGIKIYTVGVGKDGRSVMPIKDPSGFTRYIPLEDSIDEPTLKNIALKTRGEYFRAKSEDSTKIDSLASIFAQIDSLEKTKIDKKIRYEYRELSNIFLIPAFLMLLLDVFLSSLVFRRIP